MNKSLLIGIIAATHSFCSFASTSTATIDDLEIVKIIQKEESALVDQNKKQDYIQIKFGGWSHHQLDNRPDHFDYNESHNGFGVAWYNQLDEPVLYGAINVVTFEAFYMKDSYYTNQYQASIGLYHRFDFGLPLLEAIDLGVTGGFMKRGFGYVDPETGALDNVKANAFHFILPGVSWHLHERFQLDFTHIPKIKKFNLFPVTFVRGSISFKS